LNLRRALPQVLAEFEDQRIVNRLLASLPQDDPQLHYQTVKALGKMRARYTRLRFPGDEVHRLIMKESLTYCLAAGKLVVFGESPQQKGSSKLLIRALEERLEHTQEIVFRLLGLSYTPSDIFNAWNRIVHGRPPVRAAALEFLGNLLTRRHSDHVLPLLEASSWEELYRRGSRLFDLPNRRLKEVLIELIQGPDAWLSACAVTLAGEMGLVEMRGAVAGVIDHSDAVVREAAQATLDKLD
jgi:hypothetical protein